MGPFAIDGTETPDTPQDHKLSRSASIGYNSVHFAGKLSQRDLVSKVLAKQQWIPSQKIKDEVDYFYERLGIDDLYFSETSVETIAGHILSLYGAKCNAASRTGDDGLQVKLMQEANDHAVYIDTSYPGVTDVSGPAYESRLEEKYLNVKEGDKVFRLETFRSSMSEVGKNGQELRSYFVNQCNFVKENPSVSEYTDLNLISDRTFLEKATANTKTIYERMIHAVLNRTGPVIDRYEMEGANDWRLVIGMKRGTGENFFSAMTDLYHYYGM